MGWISEYASRRQGKHYVLRLIVDNAGPAQVRPSIRPAARNGITIEIVPHTLYIAHGLDLKEVADAAYRFLDGHPYHEGAEDSSVLSRDTYENAGTLNAEQERSNAETEWSDF
jgi:hypothetical protein